MLLYTLSYYILNEKGKKWNLFVSSCKKAANPSFPPAEPPNCFLVLLDNLICNLDPSNFVFNSLKRLLIMLDFFNLPMDCCRLNNLPAGINGGGGGGTPMLLLGAIADPFEGN